VSAVRLSAGPGPVAAERRHLPVHGLTDPSPCSGSQGPGGIGGPSQVLGRVERLIFEVGVVPAASRGVPVDAAVQGPVAQPAEVAELPVVGAQVHDGLVDGGRVGYSDSQLVR